MDRQLIYPGQIPLETDLLNTNKNTMIALSKLASAILGTTTQVNGLSVVPTGPASLQVLVNPGEIYSLQNIDNTAYSSIAADTTHTILKQGISLDQVTLSCPAPGTAGQSINYLIEASYQDTDALPVVLPYYNASNPSTAYSGPNNAGTTNNTVRKGTISLIAKAGTAATTGTQTTPAVDAGYTGLYVVTVANGQTQINAGNIVQVSGAPIINTTLHGLTPTFTAPLTIAPATSSSHAVQLGQVAGVVGQSSNLTMNVTAASATATMTADEIIVESALGGLRYCLSSFSKTINLATTGAGGMDTGSAPASGFVALYAIYNPTTNTSALLAKNAATLQTNVYSGANMPAGYTASALVGVWPTNGSGQFIVGYQIGRSLFFVATSALSTSTQQGSLTSFSISSVVPVNAKSCHGSSSIVSSSSGSNLSYVISGASVAIGSATGAITNSAAAGGLASAFPDIPIITAQTLYYGATSSVGTMTFSVNISGYNI